MFVCPSGQYGIGTLLSSEAEKCVIVKDLLTAARRSRTTWINVRLDSIISATAWPGVNVGKSEVGWARCVSGRAVVMGNK